MSCPIVHLITTSPPVLSGGNDRPRRCFVSAELEPIESNIPSQLKIDRLVDLFTVLSEKGIDEKFVYFVGASISNDPE